MDFRFFGSMSTSSSRHPSRTSSSLLHSMRRAWKVCLEGCPSRRILAGTAALITSFRAKVVSIGPSALALTIFLAILLAHLSSP